MARTKGHPFLLDESRRIGFTFIEIMLVVSVIMILATIAVQSLLRSRLTTSESAVIANMRTLANAVEMYHSANQSYPDDWQADLYTDADPDYGPPAFNLSMSNSTLQGYTYTYTPLPGGCTTACSDYALSSVPQTLGSTGSRAFFVDRTGVIRHCTGSGPADADDQPMHLPPEAC